MSERQAAATGARIDRLLAQLRAGPDPRAATVADELVRCLVQLYGAGLARVVTLIGPDATRDLCADPLVESLLLVHDLHPDDPATRIAAALAACPGDPRLRGIDGDGVASVRVAAAGCGVRAAVTAAVEAAAPELAGVVVEVEPALLQITRQPA